MYLALLILISVFTYIALETICYFLFVDNKSNKKLEAKNKIRIKLEKYKKFINRYKRLPQVDSKSFKEQELAIWMKSIKDELFKLNQSGNKKFVKEIQKMFNEFFSNS